MHNLSSSPGSVLKTSARYAMAAALLLLALSGCKSKGAVVKGMVDDAHKRGHFKGASDLELWLTSLTLNGKEYPLETAEFRERKKGKGKRAAAMIGGGGGLGMLIGGVASGATGLLVGGLAGAGAGTAGAGLTGNRDLVIPAESIVHFKLKADLVIEP